MKTIKTEHNSFTFYDNIKEISVGQYKEFIKASMIESGIGSDMESLREKIVNIWSFIDADKKDLARNELNNLFIATNYILDKISPLSECFLYLLKSVDGQPIDFSSIDDEHKESIKKQIESLPLLELEDIVSSVKKI